MRTPYLLLLICVLNTGCIDENANSQSLLKPSAILQSQDSTLTDFLFDKGAWFGISLNENSWGLSAPRILSDSNGYDFRDKVLTGTILINGKEVKPINHYYPGSLVQELNSDESQIIFKSIFADHQNAYLALEIKNLSSQSKTYTLNWTTPTPDSISSNVLVYDLVNAELIVKDLSGSVLNLQKEINLNGESQTTLYVNISHRFKDEILIKTDTKDLNRLFTNNNKRWSEYHNRYKQLSPSKQILASKCLQTLVNNWRSPIGELAYEGLFPSYDYEWFHGFWSWDSWKHAVALVNFEPELAKNQIRTMYHFQDEHGMIADVVYRDTLLEKHNWRDTKPPLSGWAIRKVFDSTRDTAFVEQLLPKLMKYHSWWYRNRDHNNNGVCEYGSTDGSLVAAGWESGMDNAVRFDDAKIIQVNQSAWSLNQESIDLNAYLYFEKTQIAYLQYALENDDIASQFIKDADALKIKIQNHFFDSDHGYFFDISTDKSQHIDVYGPEAWTALWTELATMEQAKLVVNKITDDNHFNTFVPFPTLSADHPKFDPLNGYWRGPVWLDQAYFALDGMDKYGFEKEYIELVEKLFNNAQGLSQKGVPIRENYHPTTGEGLNANHFSWSAAHILMLLEKEANL
ncbi:MGH1-like glycoside hydrolase domain-containing protein [Ekhidna sp.]